MHALRLLPIAAVALTLNCSIAPASAAEASEELGVKVAHDLFSALNMPELIRDATLKNSQGLAEFAKVRPEWKPLVADAMQEALAKDTPQIERITGRAFARTFTTDELSAAEAIFSDPQAQAALGAISRHGPPPSGSTCSQACMRAMNSPAGRGFMTKLKSALDQNLKEELIATILPDFFIAFGEKAKAAETKRAAGI